MWSTRQGFCTTLQTRVRHSRAWCALHARAGSLFLAYTTRSHAFPSGPGASSLGCLDTDSSRVIRCCATERASQHGARHGYGTNINIPRSTVTHWPRSRAGLPKMVSNTCARTQAQCCVRTRRSCSLPLQTTGLLRAGWHSFDGLGLLGTRAAFSLPSVGALRSSGTALMVGAGLAIAPWAEEFAKEACQQPYACCLKKPCQEGLWPTMLLFRLIDGNQRIRTHARTRVRRRRHVSPRCADIPRHPCSSDSLRA